MRGPPGDGGTSDATTGEPPMAGLIRMAHAQTREILNTINPYMKENLVLPKEF